MNFKLSNIQKHLVASAEKVFHGKERLWIAWLCWFLLPLFICNFFAILIKGPLYHFILHHLSLPQTNILFAVDMVATAIFRGLLIFMVWKCSKNAKHYICNILTKTVLLVFALASTGGIAASVYHAIHANNELQTLEKLKQS